MTDHTRTEKIDGDSILIFVITQVERETVMAFRNTSFGRSDNLPLRFIAFRYPHENSQGIQNPCSIHSSQLILNKVTQIFIRVKQSNRM